MKRNGTTTSEITRWRCKLCGASTTKSRSDITNAAVFGQFIDHCTSTTALKHIADAAGVSHSTMKRRFSFSWCWLIDVPDPTIGHTGRVYDQIFLYGTYIVGGVADRGPLVWPASGSAVVGAGGRGGGVRRVGNCAVSAEMNGEAAHTRGAP